MPQKQRNTKAKFPHSHCIINSLVASYLVYYPKSFINLCAFPVYFEFTNDGEVLMVERNLRDQMGYFLSLIFTGIFTIFPTIVVVIHSTFGIILKSKKFVFHDLIFCLISLGFFSELLLAIGLIFLRRNVSCIFNEGMRLEKNCKFVNREQI